MDTAKYLQKCMEDCCCDQCLFYQHILDTLVEPMVIVNSRAEIVFINKAYLEFINVSRSSALGKPVQDVIENTRLHQVCINGVSEVDSLQKIHGREAVVHRFPINVDNQIVGAIGKVNFQDVNELNELAKKLKSMEEKLEYYKKDTSSLTSPAYTFKDIIGCSEHFIQVKSTAIKAAQSDMSVLILGETGVGKDLFAQAIHNASPRHRGPFISINCAAIPQDLLESELFGYGEGAFTGARKQGKPGKFELADGGTIFLDEIGDMPLRMQAKLLRVLQNRQVERIGETELRAVNVRVISSTNHDVKNIVNYKEFRADLLYRLDGISIYVPSLRERKNDIPLLVQRTMQQLDSNKKFSSEVMELLMQSEWPGNVRELINIVERMSFLVEEPIIKPHHIEKFAPNLLHDKTSTHLGGHYVPMEEKTNEEEQETLSDSINNAEKISIINALKDTGNNKAQAARLLKIHRTTLYAKMKKYGLNH